MLVNQLPIQERNIIMAADTTVVSIGILVRSLHSKAEAVREFIDRVITRLTCIQTG